MSYSDLRQNKVFKKLFHCKHEEMSIENLRQFHNFIKASLIKFSKKNGTKTLLDIAVGRGGDLFKWQHNNFEVVVGFDPHKESIDEAKRRLNSQLRQKKKCPYTKYFILDMLDQTILQKLNNLEMNIKGLESHTYDVVSCQFAFHYFIKQMDKVLQFISIKLNNGGIFIGTATDGDKVHELLKVSGNVSTNLLQINKINDEKYTFNITSDSTNTYFDVKGVSEEFFLFKEQFINTAKLYDLHLLEIKSFEQWYQTYNYQMTNEECQVSFLNFSFRFIKISS